MTDAAPPGPFADLFTGPHPGGHDRLAAATASTIGAVARATGSGPRSSLSPDELAALVADLDVCPADGVPFVDVVADLAARVWAHGVRPTDPACTAHLHPPTLVTSAATEVAIATTNQSLDSWDQSPAATALELHLVGWLAATLGLPAGATGVLTAGGTASNLLGLTLARARAAARQGHDVVVDGLPPEARRWRILASAGAHFSVQRAAAQLGLGHRAVVAVATDPTGSLSPDALEEALGRLEVDGLVPLAVVGTAGTTDLGAVDPLDALADQAAAAGAWFHVDAAVGGAFALSDRLRPLLAGIGRADSVTVDLHKLWWQPIGASALLVPRADAFDVLRTTADYLDRDDDDPDDPDDLAHGMVNLVGRSLDTSRRFDAAKVVTSLRATGRRRLAAMVDHLANLAQGAAVAVAAEPGLEVVVRPATITCVFRWVGDGDLPPATVDQVNREVQLRLLRDGEAVVGRTRVGGATALKLTFVNPLTTADDVAALVRRVAQQAGTIATGAAGGRNEDGGRGHLRVVGP